MNRSRWVTIAVVLSLAFAGTGRAQEPDAKGGKDCPLMTRMPYRYVYSYSEREFDQADVRFEGKDISATGHAAVYGIDFDVDKAVVKPESAPALQEIATLLQKNLKLNIHLVGHADSTGLFDHNLKLSEARAAVVVGQLSPVASNRTEKGRARNRHVELVEQ